MIHFIVKKISDSCFDAESVEFPDCRGTGADANAAVLAGLEQVMVPLLSGIAHERTVVSVEYEIDGSTEATS